MFDFRRYFVPGAAYFFTVVSERRAPLFANQAARRLLRSVLRGCLLRRPLKVIAAVLLPDHLHCLRALPVADCAYSERWRWINREFTRA